MAKRTGPSNFNMRKLIQDLNSLGAQKKVQIWKRVAFELNRPTRSRREVSVAKLEKYTNDKETIIVPGKILSKGDLTKKINVAAFKFSEQAKDKISNVGKVMTIRELMKENPKGKKVRIIC